MLSNKFRLFHRRPTLLSTFAVKKIFSLPEVVVVHNWKVAAHHSLSIRRNESSAFCIKKCDYMTFSPSSFIFPLLFSWKSHRDPSSSYVWGSVFFSLFLFIERTTLWVKGDVTGVQRRSTIKWGRGLIGLFLTLRRELVFSCPSFPFFKKTFLLLLLLILPTSPSVL